MASRRRIVAASLVIAAVIWIAVEGPTLLVVSQGNGLTVADLPSIAALLVAAWLTAPHGRRKARQARTQRRGQQRDP
jgi:hypothetical protein